VSKFKDAIAAASKRGKKTKKKAVRKRANKKAPDRRMPPSTLPTEVNHKVGALASDVELRQFVRLWARCGWDSHQAVAKLHPELRPNEIAAVVINYRNSRHIKAALQDVLHEVSESSTMTQIEAETILTSHALTSILDFFDDDGKVLSIASMRKLPRRSQLSIKKLRVTRVEQLDDSGKVKEVKTHAEVEMYDVQKAIEQLSRLRQWGFSEGERDIAEMLKKAESRLHRNVIDINAIDPED